MRTEQRVVMILKRNRNIPDRRRSVYEYQGLQPSCCNIDAEYKLMIDLKSATIKEPYIDVDMREFRIL
jgi:hypothetical protein